MNEKTRALLALSLLLITQLAACAPLASGPGGPQPAPVYTFTSIPPFPTDTATPIPSPTATITRTLRPTSTPVDTPTPVVLATATPTAAAGSSAALVAHYMTTQPRLDGDWSEWKNIGDEYPANVLTFGKKRWDGPEDLSASFHLGWDETFLYLAIKVRDDLYVQKMTGDNLYNGDSVELLLDTLLDDDKTSTILNQDDFHIGLSAGHPYVGKFPEAYVWAPYGHVGPEKYIQVESRAESGLYRIEAAIPWNVLDITPAAGMHYGILLSVNDTDDGDGALRQTIIANLAASNPEDPTTWGDLQLVK